MTCILSDDKSFSFISRDRNYRDWKIYERFQMSGKWKSSYASLLA